MGWYDRPYAGPDQGCRPGLPCGFGLPKPTKVVKILLIVNLVIFVVVAFWGRRNSAIYQIGALQPDRVFSGQVWQLVSYQYRHSPDSVFHILFNMLGLYFLGTPLERHWGPKRFFAFYTAAGVVGGIAYLVLVALGWLSPGEMVGASGSVLGLLGACAVLFPGFVIILLFFPVPIRVAAVLFVAIYVLSLVAKQENAGGDAAHLAGLAFGVIWAAYGTAWAQSLAQRRREGAWQRNLQLRHRQEAEVDRVLDKVHREGVASLTRREKRTLQEATSRQQQEDRQRRVDRL